MNTFNTAAPSTGNFINERFELRPSETDSTQSSEIQKPAPIYHNLKKHVLTEKESWILENTDVNSAPFISQGDSTGRGDYDLFAKQIAMEKMLKTLAKWYKDP